MIEAIENSNWKTDNFKVGDLIYYDYRDKKHYCIINKITDENGTMPGIYGNWRETIKEAKESLGDNGYMNANHCFKVDRNWKERLQ